MIASNHVAFSSYPGELFSDDDFYLLSESNMVVLQTTNHIFNDSILEILTPRSAVSWQRVRVANMLAANGSAWAALLAQENSGTYNNQYMVVDLKRFVPHKVRFVVLHVGMLFVTHFHISSTHCNATRNCVSIVFLM